jgi:hypothetical protein
MMLLLMAVGIGTPICATLAIVTIVAAVGSGKVLKLRFVLRLGEVVLGRVFVIVMSWLLEVCIEPLWVLVAAEGSPTVIRRVVKPGVVLHVV